MARYHSPAHSTYLCSSPRPLIPRRANTCALHKRFLSPTRIIRIAHVCSSRDGLATIKRVPLSYISSRTEHLWTKHGLEACLILRLRLGRLRRAPACPPPHLRYLSPPTGPTCHKTRGENGAGTAVVWRRGPRTYHPLAHLPHYAAATQNPHHHLPLLTSILHTPHTLHHTHHTATSYSHIHTHPCTPFLHLSHACTCPSLHIYRTCPSRLCPH